MRGGVINEIVVDEIDEFDFIVDVPAVDVPAVDYCCDDICLLMMYI
jgi:hypothetical protein